VWIGDGRQWTLDLGGLSSRLYYYTDNKLGNIDNVNPRFVSVEIGPEVNDGNAIVEWQISQWDIFTEALPRKPHAIHA
jgi:hypothetical protein